VAAGARADVRILAVDLLLMSTIHADTKSSGGLLVDSRKVRWLSVTIALIVACGTK
jgi:hypothetical protein